MEKNKLIIIVGHYGSGKTEFALNYAVRLKMQGTEPVIVDMDIVNPYFRARELKGRRSMKNIKIISGNYEDDHHLDMPALSPALKTYFESEDDTSIVDVGGDPAGAHALSGYSKYIEGRDYSMWVAVNANRPKTSDAEGAIEYIRAIEDSSKLKITGLLNTTHLLRETTAAHVVKGDALVKEIEDITGIKAVYTVVTTDLLPRVKELNMSGEVFPIKLLLLPDWL